MVAIQKRFDDKDLQVGNGNNFYVGEGWREVMITEIELADAYVEGKPQDLLIHGVVTKGEFAHTDVNIRLSINDETFTPSGKITWAKMAHISLNQICKACGHETIPYANLDVLKRKKLNVKFVIKKGSQMKDEFGNPAYDEQGQPKLYEDTSQAREYKAIPAAATTPAAPAPAQPQQQPMQPQAPQPVAPALDDEIPF